MQIDKDNSKHSDPTFTWTKQLQSQLFSLHSQHGNKWSIISIYMNSLNQNCFKNKFYSTLRKGFRKVNKYLVNIRRKKSSPNLSCNKLIKPQFLVKLNAVVDRNYIQKYEVKKQAIPLSSQIEAKLIELAQKDKQYELKNNQELQYRFEDELLNSIQEFNRNCKRRKGKRKQNKGSKGNNMVEESVQSQYDQKQQIQIIQKIQKGQKIQSFEIENTIDKTIQKVQKMQQIPIQQLQQDTNKQTIEIQNIQNNPIQKKEKINIKNIDDIHKDTEMNQNNMFQIMLQNHPALTFNKDKQQSKQETSSTYMINPIPIGSGCFQFYHEKVKYQINNDLKVSFSSLNDHDQQNSADFAENSRKVQLSLNKLLGKDTISIFSSNSIRKSIQQSEQIPTRIINLSRSESSTLNFNNNTYNEKITEMMLWSKKLQKIQNQQIKNKKLYEQ